MKGGGRMYLPLLSGARFTAVSGVWWLATDAAKTKISKSALKSSNLDCTLKLNLSIGRMKRNCVWHVWRSFVCPSTVLLVYILFYPQYIEAIEFQISVSTLKAWTAQFQREPPDLAHTWQRGSPNGHPPTTPPSSFLTILNPSLLNPLRLREWNTDIK